MIKSVSFSILNSIDIYEVPCVLIMFNILWGTLKFSQIISVAGWNFDAYIYIYWILCEIILRVYVDAIFITGALAFTNMDYS